ncbi:PREDICTED: histidine-containing phosphotransfer protein 4-like [Nicotiana attenuata]|uniref:Histidine-containing phosphotransfer protein n=1 Tax=Nicotiana attenuata TaxID=49451 RepID=A0A1J6KMJ7_NICAT|nr:PREDICTED: histidine-containing phosphotransfer protein 4-like [Nicotiana attenuata]XP_019235387.1 PREDICTED: histidine-containing phosphotransfer protein 4-like [Nicotiana attenuata]XP_019235388.1 PREDICTED: histidine-containing phosphotransfer protein 4-like [Nicotiana attenuata]OIT26088.1 histidine-containing phosphotransfer protein 4 [Nicotiana attenuata]
MASDFARFIANLRQSLFDEKLLDQQFLQLERLESNNEGYLEDVCADYFKDAAKFVDLMVPELQGPPYDAHSIESLLHRFKGMAIGMGAIKVTHQIDCMREHLKRGDFEVCKIAFERIKQENEFLQFRLDNYFKLRKQAPPAEIEDQPEYGYMDTDSE